MKISVNMVNGLAIIFTLLLCNVTCKNCPSSDYMYMFDCWPESANATESNCNARGCCWHQNALLECIYPTDYPSYHVTNMSVNPSSYKARIQRQIKTYLKHEILQLEVLVTTLDKSITRIQVVDPNTKRWVVPIPLRTVPVPLANADTTIELTRSPFSVRVRRKRDAFIMFDTAIPGPLLYSDQFLEMSSALNVSSVYGIGERRHSLRRKMEYTRIGLWARDHGGTPAGSNLYGVHNFMMGLSSSGNAFGIFFLNSNAQEVTLQPARAITYRTIGGILDFFIFSGPTPADVYSQYQSLIGYPMMPAYWHLGFHLCRYGYRNLSEVAAVFERNYEIKIPYDTQWIDIDYMDGFKDWTLDMAKFGHLPSFISMLHGLGMHYIPIVDPAVSSEHAGQYKPYDRGVEMGVFVNNSATGMPLIGKVGPGETVFPDFSNPITKLWWLECARDFRQTVKFDGIWIDMNEPSNFVEGSTTGCTQSPLDNPPYTPDIFLKSTTKGSLCPSSLHCNATPHYNLHNLYGYHESIATNEMLQRLVPNKRPFVLSRSTFPGSGRYTYHWTGDTVSDWNNLHYSISALINFNMFGIQMTGADICGFGGHASEELCIRWTQAAAFYPFMRSHANNHASDHDPGVWSAAGQTIMRASLELRYALLPYLYTLSYRSHAGGSTVFRALLEEFSSDPVTHNIDTQFMFGSSIMVCPVLQAGVTTQEIYLPEAEWFDLYTGEQMPIRGDYAVVLTPIDRIPIFVRGGVVLVLQMPAINTGLARKNPFNIAAYLSNNGTAHGELFWDDGETTNGIRRGVYNTYSFSVENGELLSLPIYQGYSTEALSLQYITIFNVKNKPTNVSINGTLCNFTYESQKRIINVDVFDIMISIQHTFLMKWV